MDYSRLINDKEVYLYKDNSFNTINITLYFKANNGNRENAIYDLLFEYMLKANNKYTQMGISKKCKELYGLEIEWDTMLKNNIRLFCIRVDMVSPSIINDDYSLEVFNFMKDIFFDISFDKQEVLDNIKRTKLAEIKAVSSDIEEKEDCLYNSNVLTDENNIYEYSLDINYVKNIYDSINLSDLKRLYEETINANSFYRGLVFGNITDEEYIKFRNIFRYEGKKEKIVFDKKTDIKEGTIIIPNINTNETAVFITYSLDKIDLVTRDILFDILNGSSFLCLDVFRKKYDLVYNSYVDIACLGKYLCIYAKIDKKNLDKFLIVQEELIDILKDKIRLKELLRKAKESLKKEQYLLSENKKSMIRDLNYYVSETFDRKELEDFEKRLDMIVEDDIVDITNTLVKKNVFVYRGDSA